MTFQRVWGSIRPVVQRMALLKSVISSVSCLYYFLLYMFSIPTNIYMHHELENKKKTKLITILRPVIMALRRSFVLCSEVGLLFLRKRGYPKHDQKLEKKAGVWFICVAGHPGAQAVKPGLHS